MDSFKKKLLIILISFILSMIFAITMVIINFEVKSIDLGVMIFVYIILGFWGFIFSLIFFIFILLMLQLLLDDCCCCGERELEFREITDERV